MLAAASIGAIWTGVSPDTGVTAVLERLVQIKPKILLADNAVRYNGKVHGSYQKVKEIVEGLKGLQACIVLETVEGFEMKTEGLSPDGGKAWKYRDFVARLVLQNQVLCSLTVAALLQHPHLLSSSKCHHLILCIFSTHPGKSSN